MLILHITFALVRGVEVSFAKQHVVYMLTYRISFGHVCICASMFAHICVHVCVWKGTLYPIRGWSGKVNFGN